MDAITFQAKALQLERLMFHVSWSLLHREADCADAVQEALTRAWQKRYSLRNPEKFKPWLIRILINTCNDILRQRRKQPLIVSGEEIPVELESGDPSSVHEAIECLKPEWRMVILLYYMEGYSVREMAQLLHLPEGTVKSRLMYARRRLCTLMKEEWEEEP